MKGLRRLIKTKTFWVGIAAVASGAFIILNGNTEVGVQTIIAGVAYICIRDGLTKSEHKRGGRRKAKAVLTNGTAPDAEPLDMRIVP